MAHVFYKCLASLLLATVCGVMNTLWSLVGFDGFSLLQSAVQCIGGAHSPIGVFNRAPSPMDLVQVESHQAE